MNTAVNVANLSIKKNRLNLDLNKAFNMLINIGASSKGDDFTDTVTEVLVKNVKEAKIISPEKWKELLSRPEFKEHRKRCSNYSFDFSNIAPSICEHLEGEVLIVVHPNGKNRWPDQLVIGFNVGLPIEVKSQKIDGITWNGGLPRDNAVYIYNCYGLSKTTCFLGQEVISEDARKKMLTYAQALEAIELTNVEDEENEFTYYCRHMFNGKTKYFQGVNNSNEVYELEYKNLQLTEEKMGLERDTSLGAVKKIAKINEDINKNNEKIENLNKVIERGVNKTKAREAKVKSYVDSLTWDSNQYSNFNDDKSYVKVEKEGSVTSIDSIDGSFNMIFQNNH